MSQRRYPKHKNQILKISQILRPFRNKVFPKNFLKLGGTLALEVTPWNLELLWRDGTDSAGPSEWTRLTRIGMMSPSSSLHARLWKSIDLSNLSEIVRSTRHFLGDDLTQIWLQIEGLVSGMGSSGRTTSKSSLCSCALLSAALKSPWWRLQRWWGSVPLAMSISLDLPKQHKLSHRAYPNDKWA